MNAQFLKFSQALVLAAGVITASLAMADAPPRDPAQPDVVSVPLANAYIPDGFDSKNRVRMMVEGFFPSTCYRIREAQVDATDTSIGVTQTAFKYNGPCLWMMVSYSQPVNVGILKASAYTVKDSFSGRVLGALPVAAAKEKIGPDDYFYANVKDAFVGNIDGGARTFVVNGVLPGDCWKLKEKRVFIDGKNVITILPIAEKTEGPNCKDVETPFVTMVDIPSVPAGRYMLHVRSLNGESIMKLIDL